MEMETIIVGYVWGSVAATFELIFATPMKSCELYHLAKIQMNAKNFFV